MLALIAISLACMVAQWYSYGGSWKWVTILSILVGMVHLLSAICFCISSYVHQQLHSLDCRHFVHYIFLVLFTFLRTPHGCKVSFLKGSNNFQNCLRWHLSPTQSLKEALPMTHRMYSIVRYIFQKLSVFQPSSPLYSIHPLRSGLNDLLDDQRARAVVNSEGTLGLLAASLLHNLVQFRIPVLQSQNLTHFLHKNYSIIKSQFVTLWLHSFGDPEPNKIRIRTGPRFSKVKIGLQLLQKIRNIIV